MQPKEPVFDKMLKKALREGKKKQAEGRQSSWQNSQEKKHDAAVRRAKRSRRQKKTAL